LGVEEVGVFQTVTGINHAGVLLEERVLQGDFVGVGRVSEKRVRVHHEVGAGLAEEVEHGFNNRFDQFGFE